MLSLLRLRKSDVEPSCDAERVPFIVAELGRDADPFMLHLYAALAEKERPLQLFDQFS